MKTIIKIVNCLIISFFFAGVLYVQPIENKNKIKLGMLFSEAKEILSNQGIKAEKRYLDVIIPEDIEVSNFPIEEQVDLTITRKKVERKSTIFLLRFIRNIGRLKV